MGSVRREETLEERVSNPLYKNWIKAGICLFRLKNGLENFMGGESEALHFDIWSSVTLKPCGSCTDCDTLCSKCQQFKRKIQRFHSKCPNWGNTDVRRWADWQNGHWSIARCFMNEGQLHNNSAAAADISAILNFIINCKKFKEAAYGNLQNNAKSVRENRNKLIHSGADQLSDADLNSYTSYMLKLLEDANPDGKLKGKKEAEEAKDKITEVLRANCVIYLEDEIKVKLTVLEGQIDKMKNELLENDQKLAELDITDITEFKTRSTRQGQQIEKTAEEVKRLKEHDEILRPTLDKIRDDLDAVSTLRASLVTDDEIRKLSEQVEHSFKSLKHQIVQYRKQLDMLQSKVTPQLKRHEASIRSLDCRLTRHKTLIQSHDSKLNQHDDFIKNYKRHIKKTQNARVYVLRKRMFKRKKSLHKGSPEEDERSLNTYLSMNSYQDWNIRVRKLYHFFKAELSREEVMAIAQHFPKRNNIRIDVVEMLEKTERRRLCIDHLLKSAIQSEEYLKHFLVGLKSVCPKMSEQLSQTNVTEEDRKKYKRVQDHMVCRRIRTCLTIYDRDIMFFKNHISDCDIIDEINDVLFSRFYFNVHDHSEITKYSVKDRDIQCVTILFRKIQSCHWDLESELENILKSTLPSNVYIMWSQKRNKRSVNEDHPGFRHCFNGRIHDKAMSMRDVLNEKVGILYVGAQSGCIILKFLAGDSFRVETLKPELVKEILMEVISGSNPVSMNPVLVSVFIDSPRSPGKEIIYFYLDFEAAADKKKKKEDGNQLGMLDIDYMAEEMNPTPLKQWIGDHTQIDANTKTKLTSITSWETKSRREKMKLLLDTMKKVKNGYKMLENYCEEHDTFVYNKVFGKTRQLPSTKTPGVAQIAELSHEKKGRLQKLYSMCTEVDVDSEGLSYEKEEGLQKLYSISIVLDELRVDSEGSDLTIVHGLDDGKLDLSGTACLSQIKLEKTNVASISLSQCTQLQKLEMIDVNLDDDILDLSGAFCLSQVKLEEMTVSSISLSQCTQLQRLTLRNVNIGDGILDLSGDSCLSELSIHEVSMSSISISQCTQLEKVTMENVNIGDGILDLSEASYLSELRMDDMNCSTLSLSECTQLERLTMRLVNIDGGKLDLSAASCLSELSIHSVGMSSICLSQCTQLQKLTVENVTIDDSILDLSGASCLSELSMYQVSMSSISLSQCTQLQKLKLSYVNIDDGILDMSGACCLSKLRMHKVSKSSLRLNYVNIGDVILDLSGASCLSQLRLYYMTMTRISISQCTQLRELTLKNVEVGDGKLDISEASCMSALSLINVSMPNVSLPQFKKLCELTLENVSIGDGKLDLSGASYLSELSMYKVNMPSISLSQCTQLKKLTMHNVNMDDSKLDLYGASCLLQLGLDNMNMSSISVSQCTQLQKLSMHNVNMGDGKLDLSGASCLSELSIHTVNMSNINMSQCTQLKKVTLENVKIGDGKLDLSRAFCLLQLGLDNMNMSSISLSQCTQLQKLTMHNVNMGDGKLDLSGASCLSELSIHTVNMSSISLPQYAPLSELTLENVKIGDRKLDIQGTLELASLCMDNVTMSSVSLPLFDMLVNTCRRFFKRFFRR